MKALDISKPLWEQIKKCQAPRTLEEHIGLYGYLIEISIRRQDAMIERLQNFWHKDKSKDWEPVDTEGFYGPMDLKDKLETQQEEMEEMEEKKRLYEKLKKIFEPKPDEVE